MLDDSRAICTHVGGGESGARDFPPPVPVLGVATGGEDIRGASAGISRESVKVTLLESMIETVD